MRTWVCVGCWSLSHGEYEDVWSRADDDAKRVNDPQRFEAEKLAAVDDEQPAAT